MEKSINLINKLHEDTDKQFKKKSNELNLQQITYTKSRSSQQTSTSKMCTYISYSYFGVII